MDALACLGLATVELAALRNVSLFQEVHPKDFKSSYVLSILFIIQFISVKYYRIFLYHKYSSPLRHIPGPKDNHVFFGQVINLLKADTPVALYVKWMRENPEAPFIRYLSFSNTEILVPSSPAAFRELFQTQCYSFKKPDRWRRMTKDFAGPKGLASLEFDEHRLHRRMLNTPLSISNIRRLDPVIRAKAKQMIDVIDGEVELGNVDLDCTNTFTKSTLDLMGVTITGSDLSNIIRTTNKAITSDDTFSFHEAYNGVFGMSDFGKLLMFANAFLPVRWLPLEANRNFKRATKFINESLRELVRQRRQEISEAFAAGTYKRGESRDILSFLLEESQAGGSMEGMADDYIADHILVILGAGHDTSANILSWSLHSMVENKVIQDKLRLEVKDLCKRNSDPTTAEIDALPYLNNFVREILRVYPTACLIYRQAAVDTVIEGIKIPAGTTFDIAPVLTSMRREVWGDDADIVRPERWDQLTPEQSSPFAYSPFSNGPRICIGKQFAYLEIKAFLFELIRTYRFLSIEGPFTVETPSLVLRPNGLKIKIGKI